MLLQDGGSVCDENQYAKQGKVLVKSMNPSVR